jgi:hypothetical protein
MGWLKKRIHRNISSVEVEEEENKKMNASRKKAKIATLISGQRGES